MRSNILRSEKKYFCHLLDVMTVGGVVSRYHPTQLMARGAWAKEM